MVNYWKIVNRVIHDSDIILLVLDSRLPHLTRNIEIENKVKKAQKNIIYVINKCDLIEKKLSDQLKKEINQSVFVSGKMCSFKNYPYEHP